MAGEATLFIDEKIINRSRTKLDIMWGHHIAFGLPFLRDEILVESNAKKMISEPAMPAQRRFKAGIETDWPMALNIQGEEDNASKIPPASESPYSELTYLYGFPKSGEYSIVNSSKKIGFGLTWDADIFKYLWLWQERFATQDAPWWGNAYAIALEPWTAMWKPDAEQAIRDGEWLSIDAEEIISTKLSASIITL